MKKVKMHANDERHNDYWKGDIGIIDGYVIRDGLLCAVVIIKHKRLVCAPVRDLEIVNNVK